MDAVRVYSAGLTLLADCIRLRAVIRDTTPSMIARMRLGVILDRMIGHLNVLLEPSKMPPDLPADQAPALVPDNPYAIARGCQRCGSLETEIADPGSFGNDGLGQRCLRCGAITPLE